MDDQELLEREERLRLINKAILIFPQVVARKERAYRELQKRLKDFEPLSLELKKRVEEK